MIFLTLFNVFLLCVMSGDTSRILVWIPTPSISHQVMFRPLTQELVRRGHELVYITTDPGFPSGNAPQNLTVIDVHDISYKIWESFLSSPKGKASDIFEQARTLSDLFNAVVYKQLNDTAVQEVIFGKHKFDLLILEACILPILAVTHVFKAPTIVASSFGPLPINLEVMGAPTQMFLYPTSIHLKTGNLNLWEKLYEFYLYLRIQLLISSLEPDQNKELQKYFGSDLPTITELHNNVDMLLLTMHPQFQGNNPVPPGVVYMWGIQQKPEEELPQDLKTYLDNSKHGVIYMSFGTNTDPTKMSPNIINTFTKVFCQLPYDVLFKWNNDELPGRCDNVKIGKWFPQSDLLKHSNIKLFITQGGLQSTYEAINARVPLIGIPMLGDQWYNVGKYVQLKIGVQLDAFTLTEEQFMNAINTVIDDESYRRNIEKLDDLIKDEPMQPLERVMWWIEHVLRHGGARHLRSPGANISYAEYFEIELVILVLSILFVSIAGLVSLAYYIFRTLRPTQVKSKTQ